MYCGYQGTGTGTYDITRSATDTGWTVMGGTATCRRLFITHTIRDYWAPVVRLMPKNWRWYHVYFGWTELIVPRITAVYSALRRFIQDRISLKQRARRKRRAYIQSLHAA